MIEATGRNPAAYKLRQEARSSLPDYPERSSLVPYCPGGVWAVQRLPRIELAEELLPLICDYVARFIEGREEEVEIGGMFVGQYAAVEGIPTFRINGLIEAGPRAESAPGSILFDHEYQGRMLEAIRLQHPSVGNMGCIHLHPGQMDECSIGDYLADLSAVWDSDTKALVFALITANNPRQNPLSVYYRNFKLDFFVLGRATCYDYLQVRPTLAKTPVVQAAPALAKLLLARGPEASSDLAALHRFDGLEKLSVHFVERASQAPAVLVTARLHSPPATVHIVVEENGAIRALLARSDGGFDEFPGEWESPEAGRRIWLSHLLLAVTSRLASGNAAVRFGRHHAWSAGLLADKRRLVAEVRAMEERYGNLAVLRCIRNQLYWEYTVVESGRRFPIEVRYSRRYPIEAPRLFSMVPLPPSPHQLLKNELCWINRSTGEWNPARDTAATCIAAAHRWFACLLVYLTLGRWPEEANEDSLRPV